MVSVGKIVDSQVEVISLRVVEEITTPSSTNIAEFVDIFLTVAETWPLDVEKVSVSSTAQAFSQGVLLDLVF